jgi:hypothetical protein
LNPDGTVPKKTEHLTCTIIVCIRKDARCASEPGCRVQVYEEGRRTESRRCWDVEAV